MDVTIVEMGVEEKMAPEVRRTSTVATSLLTTAGALPGVHMRPAMVFD